MKTKLYLRIYGKTPGTRVCVCVPTAGGAETGRSQGLAGQSV